MNFQEIFSLAIENLSDIKNHLSKDGDWFQAFGFGAPEEIADRQKLILAFDLLGIQASLNQNKELKTSLFRLRSHDTGPMDIAIKLRDSFSSNLIGPNEELEKSFFEHVGTNKGESGGLALNEIFEKLSSVGFSLHPVAANSNTPEKISLTWKMPIDLKLAPDKDFPILGKIRADEILESIFPDFKHYLSKAQQDIINTLCVNSGKQTIIGRLPTGGGKSLCYFLPVLYAKSKGTPHMAIVVSPTVSLQNDQVREAIESYGKNSKVELRAAQLNQTVKNEERKKVYHEFVKGELDILFLSPEKLIEPHFRNILHSVASKNLIGFMVIDEAHIVASWGNDFRTDFFRLGTSRRDLLKHNPELKTLLLSATLTAENENIITDVLQIKEDEVTRFTEESLRREISIRIEKKWQNKESRLNRLLEILPHVPKPVIIYCSLKTNVEELYKALYSSGLKRVLTYTGDTTPSQRQKRLNAFQSDDVYCVIATNAFGMGINKSDVRTVIHFDVPYDLDSYYQEIGRASRDHKTGHSIFFYSAAGMGHVNKSNMSIITPEKSMARLMSLYEKSYQLDGSPNKPKVLVPIHCIPDDSEIEKDSEQNRRWNRVVLNIMEKIEKGRDLGPVYRYFNFQLLDPNCRPDLSETANDLLISIAKLAENLSEPKELEIDLADLAWEMKIPFEDLFSALGELVDKERISTYNVIDEEKGEKWELVQFNSASIISNRHHERIERVRIEEQNKINRLMQDFAKFISTDECRMKHFAKLYQYAEFKDCGHCDNCGLGQKFAEPVQSELGENLINFSQMLRKSYYQLIVLQGQGKTAFLKELEKAGHLTRIDLGEKLSKALLQTQPSQWPIVLVELISEFVREAEEKLVAIDNIEILFTPDLKIDPGQLLKDLSRHQPLVVAWPGIVEQAELWYKFSENSPWYKTNSSELLIYKINEKKNDTSFLSMKESMETNNEIQ